MRLNVSSAKWRPFCLGLNVLRLLLFQWANQAGGKATIQGHFGEESIDTTDEFPAPGASDIEIVSVPCHHHERVKSWPYYLSHWDQCARYYAENSESNEA